MTPTVVLERESATRNAYLIFNKEALAGALDFGAHQAIAGPARERIKAAFLPKDEPEILANAPLHEQLERDFFELAAEYESSTAGLSPDGRPPRDAADVIGWIDNNFKAVSPNILEDYNVLTEGQRRTAKAAFYTIVFYDVALEEKEETLRASNRPEAGDYTRKLAHRRIIDKDDFDLETDPDFLALLEPEKEYARMLDHSISLLDRSVGALCDQEGLEEKHNEQLNQIQAAMDVDRKNLLVMMDFGRQFDEFIRGQREVLTGFFETAGGGRATTLNRLPTTREFNNAAQLNIFLRYMLLGNFKMLWGALPEEKRQKFNFEKLLSEMIAIGQKMDSLGNLSNDISLWKEIKEGTGVNTHIVEAMNAPDSDARVSKEEFLSSHDALNQMDDEESKQLIGKIVKAYFSGKYESVSPKLKEEYPDSPVLGLMDKLLKNGGAYNRILDLWNEEYQCLEALVKDSEVGKLYDVDALLEAQHLVLMRYAASVVQKMKI